MNNSYFNVSKGNIFFKLLFLIIISFTLLPICAYAADDIAEDGKGELPQFERRECTLNLITTGDSYSASGDVYITIDNYAEDGACDEIRLYPSDWNSSVTVGYLWDDGYGSCKPPHIDLFPASIPVNYDVFIDTHELEGANFGNSDTYNIYIEIIEKMTPWLYVDADGQFTGNFSFGDYCDENYNDLTQNFEPGTLVLGSNRYGGSIRYDVETDESGITSGAPWECYCDNIKKIVFWGQLTDIEYNSLSQYEQLETIDVITGNTHVYSSEYSAEDGVLYNADKTTLIKYPCKKAGKKFTIQDNITEIAVCAFENNCFLEEISIPSKVQYIGDGAFQGCTSLNNVVLPETVTVIYSDTFQWCTSLSNITLPKDLKTIDGYVFRGCTSLNNITLPETVTAIYSSAFQGCTSLSNITLPKDLKTIGTSVFQGCTSLSSITLPKDLKTIDDYVFQGCTNLHSISIPEAVQHINAYAFSECKNLAALIIPQNVSYISPYAFNGCVNLRNLSIDENNKVYCAENGLILSKDKTTLAAYLHSNTEKEFSLPQYLTVIGNGAFSYNDTLKKVKLSYNMQTIESGAFSDCSSLSEIIVPKALKKVEPRAFYNCGSLNKICYEGSVYDWLDISISEYNGYFINADKTYNYITTHSSYINKNGVIWVNTAIPDTIPDTAHILVASYSGNTFLELGSFLEKQEDNSITYLLNSKDVSNIKIFVWNSLENLSPTTHFEEIDITSAGLNL